MPLDTKGKSSTNLYRELLAAKLPGTANRPAVRTAEDRLSYGALDRAVREIRAHLVTSGVVAGDRVSLRIPNSPALIAAALAVAAEGAIAVPVDPQSSAVRASWIDEATTPRLSLTTDRSESESTAASALRLALDPGSGAVTGTLEQGRAVVSGRRQTAGLAPPAVILFSSGSTGRPKGVVLTHEAVIWSARSLSNLFGFTAAHRELIFAPLAHSGAWQRATATLAAGGEICLFEGPLTVAHLLEATHQLAATGFYTPPHLARYLLNADASRARAGLATIRNLEIGSAAITADELASLLALLPGTDIYVHYGLTECSRATVLDARTHTHKLSSVGRPRPGVDIAIADETGRRLGPGQVGQILVRGPQMAQAYWGEPELTARTLVDGWLATGDYGAVDGEGFLTYHGRRDDLINCSGYTFFPTEVETELGPLPGVAEYLG